MRYAASATRSLLIYLAVLSAVGSARAECTNYAEPLYRTSGVDTPGIAQDVAASGSYAFVADDQSGLEVVDLSDPSSPRIVGNLDTAGISFQVAASGNLVYLIHYGSGLRIIDVSDPAAPRQVGFLSGSTYYGVAVEGTTVYLTIWTGDAQSGLRVIDASDPTAPRIVGGANTGGGASAVAVSGGIACLADGSALRIIDVSVPTSPLIVGTLDAPAWHVCLEGDTAYIVSGSDDLRVVDLSNPTFPQIVGSAALAGSAEDVAVSGGRVFVAAGSRGLQEFDVSEPTAPVPVREVSTLGMAWGVAMAGAYACVAVEYVGLRVFDTLNPPAQAGRLSLPDLPTALTVRRSLAYVVAGSSSQPVGYLGVVDVSDPGAPVVQGSCSTLGGPTSILKSGSCAYVGVSYPRQALEVFDVYDPPHPSHLGSVTIPGSAYARIYAMAVRGTYVYAAADEAGLVVFDVSNPAAPSVAAVIDTPTDAVGIGIEGQYAFVLGSSYWFLVYDLANPISPQLVATQVTAGAYAMCIDQGHAYVVGSHVFYVMDISSPLSPQLVGSLHGIPSSDNVAVSGGYAYSTSWGYTGGAGMLVVDIENPTAPTVVGSANVLQGPHAVTPWLDAVFVADNSGLRVLPVQCSASGIGDQIAQAQALTVWPNPARGQAEIRFVLDAASPARLDLFDAAGRLVRRLLDRPLAPGPQAIRWNATDDRGRALPAGAYRVRLEAGGATRVGSAIVLR